MTRVLDSHVHLDLEAFASDLGAVMQRADEAGVRVAMIPGVCPSRWSSAASLARRVGAHHAYGLHPFELTPEVASDWESIALGLSRACEGQDGYTPPAAVGETGLDARLERTDGPLRHVDRSLQERALTLHLEVAARFRLPVILHCVGAHGRLLEILRVHGPLASGGVLHAYSGSAGLVPAYAALGLSFGFGAAATLPRAKKLHAALRAVPEGRLLLETDAPDMAPRGLPGSRGLPDNRNEPSFLREITRELARLRAEAPDSLASLAAANTERLFGSLPEPVRDALPP